MGSDKLIKTLKRKLILARGDAFDDDYATYLSGDLAYLHKALRERRFTVGETTVAYRVINHWAEKGLLPVMSLHGGWRKFTFVELVWLKAIEHLRVFGLSLEKIAQVAENILEWDKKKETYPVLEYYVVKALASNLDTYIIVDPDGKSDVGSSRDIENLKDMRGHQDFILISIKLLLEDLGLTPTKSETLFALTESERNLIHKIRLRRQKEIKVTPRNGAIEELETLYTFTDRQEFLNIRQEIVEAGGFADVTEKYVSGKKVSGEIKRKERFVG